MAEAVMNPEVTGWLRKCATNPSRSAPMISSTAPDKAARVSAAAACSAVPGTATVPTAVAVISEMTATGPTASTRLLPNTA